VTDFFRNFKYLIKFFQYLVKNFSIFKYLICGVIFLSIFEYITLSISLLLVENANLIKEANSSSVIIWKNIFDFFKLDFDKNQILWLFIILLTFRILFGFIFSNLTFYFSKKIHYFFNAKIFNEIINNISLLKIYNRTVGYYLQLAGDSSFKSGAIVVSILDLIVAAISGIVSLYILYQFSAFFFLVSCVFLFFCLIIYSFLFKVVLKLNHSSVNFSKLASTIFLDGINNLRSIRTIKGGNFIISTHDSLMKEYTKLLFILESLKKTLKIVPVIILLLFSIYYFYPNHFVNRDSLDISFFFTLIIILSRVLSSFGVILISFIDFLTQFKFVRDINDLIDVFNHRNSSLKKYNTNSKINNSIISSITLKNLNFNFNKNRKIIDNFNYNFLKNNIYAITGKSGTGKSTLADIISGLTFDFKGDLFFNNNIKIRNLFSNIILVEQDSRIFTGTVYENLTLGSNFNPEEVKKILMYLGLDKFANNLYLRLNYKGSNISGGEKQRFAIARALLRKPDVLILDEATNALDKNNFALVIKKLKLSMKNKILIFITHESRVNKYVDKIIEFK
jgi:ATP-binding cassette subfamily B protein